MVMVGSSWRMSFDNTSCRTFYRGPASNGNSSTIAMACKQCQTNYPIGPGVAFVTRVECTFLHKPRSTLCRNLHPMWRFTRKFSIHEPTTEPNNIDQINSPIDAGGCGGKLAFCRCPQPGIAFIPRFAACTRDPGDITSTQLPCGQLSLGDVGRGSFGAR